MSYNAIIDMQNQTNRVHFENGQKNLGSGRLDRNGFLRMVMTQLQHQDPTNPSDSTQMLTQQLALEQAEQMREMVQSNKFSQAATMVGKQAELVDARWDFVNNTSGTPEWDYQMNVPKIVQGTIEGVQFDRANDKALVKVGNYWYDADLIQTLANPQVSAPPPPSTDPDPVAPPGTDPTS